MTIRSTSAALASSRPVRYFERYRTGWVRRDVLLSGRLGPLGHKQRRCGQAQGIDDARRRVPRCARGCRLSLERLIAEHGAVAHPQYGPSDPNNLAHLLEYLDANLRKLRGNIRAALAFGEHCDECGL